MGNAWVIRAYPHNKYRMEQFLSENIVAIGWPTVGDLSGKGAEEIKQILQRSYSYPSNRSLGQAVGTINRFVNEMKLNDYVVVPDGPAAFIGWVKSDYVYDESKDNDAEGYPHQRKVEWLNENRGILRSAVTGRVSGSLKGQQTLFATYFDDIDDIVKNKKHLFTRRNYTNLKRQYLKKLESGRLIGVDSSRFEESVRIVLDRFYPGMTRLSTANSPEGDTDLKTTLPGGIVVRVQVKHFYSQRGPLENWVVDQLAESMDEGDFGIIVTSGVVAEESVQKAEKYYKENYKKISFIDGAKFVDLIFENLDSFTEGELKSLGLDKKVDLL